MKRFLGICAVLIFSTHAPALAAPSTGSDTTPNGYRISDTQPIPDVFATYATLTTGNTVFYDGAQVSLLDPDGNLLLDLGMTPGGAFPSFVVTDPAEFPNETYALVGESNNHNIYRVDLAGGGVTLLANLTFNFDAEFEPDGMVIVSTSPGFGFGSDIYRLDPKSGATTLLGHVSGPSGPIAIDAAGDLYYALQPALVGDPVDVLTWTEAQIHSGNPIDENNAALFAAGLDTAISMAFEPKTGNLFVAESSFSAPTNSILELDITGSVIRSVATSPRALNNLEFLPGRGEATFQPYQPNDGVRLRYQTTDFYTTAQIVDVEPARPELSVSYAGSAVTVSISGADPDGAFLLFWNDVSVYTPEEFALDLGFGFPFITGMDFSDLGRFGFWMPINASGNGSFSYFDPGRLAGTMVWQGLVTDANLTPLGSTSADFN